MRSVLPCPGFKVIPLTSNYLSSLTHLNLIADALDFRSMCVERSQKARRAKFCSRRAALPVKMNFHDSAFIGWSPAKPGELDPWQLYATAHCYTGRTNGCHIPNARWNSRLVL